MTTTPSNNSSLEAKTNIPKHQGPGKQGCMQGQTRILLLLAISALMSTLGVQAAVHMNVPEDNQPPFYARTWPVLHNDDWAAIVFYREPSCVPPDFNLLEFFDLTPDPIFGLRVFGCPLTIAGFEVWEHGPGLDLGPFQEKSYGLGAVPIWFVRWPELQALMGDGILTMGELSTANSLRIGSAGYYTETGHPDGAAQVRHFTINAHGELTDGTRFQLQAASAGIPVQHMLIRFW